MVDDLSSFKTLFINTASEHIGHMQQALVTLAQNQKDQASVENLFVAAHSLKGESDALGYMSTGELSHMLEKIFRYLRDTKASPNSELLAAATRAVAKLQESIKAIENEDKEVVTTDVLMQLEKTSGITVSS